MQASVLISEGFTLMLLGMGTVFVFLSLLVLMMYVIAFLLQRFSPLAPDVANSLTPESSRPPDPLLAVISIAIHRHRQRNRR